MRTTSTSAFLHAILFFCPFLLLYSNTASSQDNSRRSALIKTAIAERAATGSRTLPHGVSEDWYNKALAGIEAREFFIKTLDRPGTFAAVNHAQHLGYMFTDQGYLVKNFNDDGSAKGVWQTSFLFKGIGRGKNIPELPLQKVSQSGDRSLRYDYGEYFITYNNDKAGMEQVFQLDKRPEGSRELVIAMGLKGDLEARTGMDNQLLLYSSGHPQDVKLVYDQVRVTDRNNRNLPVHLCVTGKHQLLLKIDDSQAAYPITVDPLNHTPATILTGQHLLFAGLDDLVNPTLFGYSLSGAGDVNGDGFGDIIVGAPTFVTILSISGGTFNVAATGAAFIFYGSGAGLPTTPSHVLQPSNLAPSALFGFSVSGAGDVDNDGKADVVIGAPGDTVDLTVLILKVPVVTGKVYVYEGSTITAAASLNVIPAPARVLHLNQADFGVLSVAPPAAFFGWSVDDAGDVNKDGFGDIVIGCPLFNNLLSPIVGGRVDVFNGSATGIGAAPSRTILGTVALGLLGWSVGGAGDVNNDTYADIIVGAPGTVAGGGIVLGAAYIFEGGPTGITGTSTSGAAPSGPNTTLHGTGSLLQTLFGFSVSTAGDVNGDGFADVIVGEPLALDGIIPNIVAAGKAYIFYGSGTGISTSGFTSLRSPRSPTVLGSSIGSLLFGYSVGAAGDVNVDGFGDVLVGEPGSTAISALSTTLGLLTTSVLSGAVYLFSGHGGAGIPTNTPPEWTLMDVATLTVPNLLGISVHGSGDVNGDGISDFLVGAANGSLDLSLNLSGLVGSLTGGSGGGIKISATTSNAYSFSGTAIILPVNLVSFTGKEESGQSVLNWSTAQEQNSDYFEIDRSAQENGGYTSIGKVGAAHNSSQLTNYTFTDASPASGINYYRLKMADLDGKFVYSGVVVLNYNSNSQNLISVYPNPAHESFQLQFKNMQPGKYEMSLLSQAGQVVLTRSIQVSDPVNHQETVTLPTLASGTYVVRIVDQSSKTYISKLLVK